jgi:hypothetical protein
MLDAVLLLRDKVIRGFVLVSGFLLFPPIVRVEAAALGMDIATLAASFSCTLIGI